MIPGKQPQAVAFSYAILMDAGDARQQENVR
jgi:hypothetical protein